MNVEHSKSNTESDITSTSITAHIEETANTNAQTTDQKRPVQAEAVYVQNDVVKVLYNTESDSIAQDAIIEKIKENNIGAMCVQKTWGSGDIFSKKVKTIP